MEDGADDPEVGETIPQGVKLASDLGDGAAVSFVPLDVDFASGGGEAFVDFRSEEFLQLLHPQEDR